MIAYRTLLAIWLAVWLAVAPLPGLAFAMVGGAPPAGPRCRAARRAPGGLARQFMQRRRDRALSGADSGALRAAGRRLQARHLRRRAPAAAQRYHDGHA